jgi:hypothetical protein
MTTLIVVPLALFLVAWTPTRQPSLYTAAYAESQTSEGVDAEIRGLLQELRDLPGDVPVRVCTPCNIVSKVVGAKRRREIYDRLDALGSAAVPALARMLRSSLQGSDKDLTDTIFWILGTVTGPYTDRYGKQHERTDISAALPVLIIALDDPTARGRAARTIGAIGQKAEKTVPKLVAMLGEDHEPSDACWGLQGIDPLPSLRQERSDPNPDNRRFAQQAIASIKEKCFWAHEERGTLDQLARTTQLICKATVIADRAVNDDSFKPIEGQGVHEAELRVVSTVKGNASDVIRFRHYAPSFGLMAPMSEPPWDTYTVAAGRTYLVLATQIAGDTYREAEHTYGINQGVLLAADAKPHHGTTLSEAAWAELLALLKSPVEDDAIGAIRQLDQMSGGPQWRGPAGARDEFERDEALLAVGPLVGAKNVNIATAAVNVFGRDSPYFSDQDVPFWLAGGRGHIAGLAARKRPTNSVVADIGAKELLQVATAGTAPGIRALAIRAVGRRPHAYSAEMVATWFRDPSVEVRRAAVLVNADLPDHEPIMIASTDDSPELRRAAALAVGLAQDPRLLPLLDKLLHDPVAEIRSTAALSLLSYPVDQGASVMKANLRSDFRPLFVNALASVDPQPYVAMLVKVIEEGRDKRVFEQMPANWNYGGVIPAADSWQILFEFVRSRPAAELTAGKADRWFDALEQGQWFTSKEPIELYALYVNRGLASRAKEFRKAAGKKAGYDLDRNFDIIDKNPAENPWGLRPDE